MSRFASGGSSRYRCAAFSSAPGRPGPNPLVSRHRLRRLGISEDPSLPNLVEEQIHSASRNQHEASLSQDTSATTKPLRAGADPGPLPTPSNSQRFSHPVQSRLSTRPASSGKTDGPTIFHGPGTAWQLLQHVTTRGHNRESPIPGALKALRWRWPRRTSPSRAAPSRGFALRASPLVGAARVPFVTSPCSRGLEAPAAAGQSRPFPPAHPAKDTLLEKTRHFHQLGTTRGLTPFIARPSIHHSFGAAS
jgi:hypothetical protein